MNAKSSSSRSVGYARVSSNGQELKLQLDALTQAGCAKADIFTDKVSGAKSDRPGLDRCIAQIKPGDVLIVWRLDRLGRSMRHLIDLVDQLGSAALGSSHSSFRALEPLLKCRNCTALARPNVLMFGDWSWLGHRTESQQEPVFQVAW